MFGFSVFFFIVILENSVAFQLSFSSPMIYSSKEIVSHIAPSLQPPPPNQKIPLKTSMRFPITIAVCVHWSKFVTCSPSSGDCKGRESRPKTQVLCFRLCGTKWLSQNFDPLTLGKKSVGGGPRCHPIFRSLKRALELFNSVRMSPLATFQDHLVDTMAPREKNKKKTTNKQAPVIYTKFHIFVDSSLKFLFQDFLIR